MNGPVAFNQGCHALLQPGTCVAMDDRDGNGRSDGAAMRFTGEDGHRYEVRAETPAFDPRWGPGSTFTVVDRSFGPPDVLARYRVSANYTLTPADVGRTDCRASAPLATPAGDLGDALTLPNGQRVILAAGNDGELDGAPRPWALVTVTSSGAEPLLQFATEAAIRSPSGATASATERGVNYTMAEVLFVDAADVPPTDPVLPPDEAMPDPAPTPSPPSGNALQRALDWWRSLR